MSNSGGDYYDKISNPSKWLAIIVTDYKETDKNWKGLETDKKNIKKMLAKLGFINENIKELHNIVINVVTKLISGFCTFGKSEGEEDNVNKHDGYILMFNLTYKKSGNAFRAERTWYKPEEILNCFVVNNLKEWATKPKLIFYQTAKIGQNYNLNSDCQSDNVSKEEQEIEYPIEADIFQSFSNDDNEDSLGNENGSFYVQSLCEIINQHIDNGTIKDTDLMHIMYKVHARMSEMVGKAGSQIPHFKSTFVKKFKFPVILK